MQACANSSLQLYWHRNIHYYYELMLISLQNNLCTVTTYDIVLFVTVNLLLISDFFIFKRIGFVSNTGSGHCIGAGQDIQP
jgi:hypothetical protein